MDIPKHLKNLPEDAYVVGGYARCVIGKDSGPVKDIDIMFPNLESIIEWCVDNQILIEKIRNGLMNACYLSTVDSILHELWVNPADDVEDYVNRTPCNVDGIAVRWNDNKLEAFMSNDFHEPFSARPKDKIIKTGSYTRHVYRMWKKFTKENS